MVLLGALVEKYIPHIKDSGGHAEYATASGKLVVSQIVVQKPAEPGEPIHARPCVGHARAAGQPHKKGSPLQDLHRRLEQARYAPPLEGAAFHYGFNSSYLQKVVAYWRNQFDWRKQVEVLNKYPHFQTTIEGKGVSVA